MFNLKNWLVSKIGSVKTVSVSEIISDEEVQEAIANMFMKELAFYTCVNKIANALSKCEFKTYLENIEVKGDEWYKWNVEPNQNQNASVFLNKLVEKLYRTNEALVVEINQNLYVADHFLKEEHALYDHKFEGITIDGYTLNKTFYMKDVLYFELNSTNVKKYVDGMNQSYSQLLTCAFKAYQKSRGSRGILKVGAIAQAQQNFEEEFRKLITEHFSKFFKADNAVLPLFDGYDYQDISNSSKTYSVENTRDIKALADDTFEFTARAFSFPPSLAKGDVQDTSKATDELLSFVIDSLAKMISQEINRKRNGKEVLNGNYLKVDTTSVKHIDLFDVATPVDKLISSGAFTINDILETIGKPKLDEEWADQHFITKNYGTIQDILSGLDAGTGKENI